MITVKQGTSKGGKQRLRTRRKQGTTNGGATTSSRHLSCEKERKARVHGTRRPRQKQLTSHAKHATQPLCGSPWVRFVVYHENNK